MITDASKVKGTVKVYAKASDAKRCYVTVPTWLMISVNSKDRRGQIDPGCLKFVHKLGS